MRNVWQVGDHPIEVDLEERDGKTFVRAGELELTVEQIVVEPGFLNLLVDGRHWRIPVLQEQGETLLALDGVSYAVVSAEDAQAQGGADAGAFQPNIKAPMPGKVLEVLVSEGDLVDAESALLILEAMKMEQTVRATAPARVVAVHTSEGSRIGPGDLLLVLEELKGDEA